MCYEVENLSLTEERENRIAIWRNSLKQQDDYWVKKKKKNVKLQKITEYSTIYDK